jgi:phospholipase/carboxylesterase
MEGYRWLPQMLQLPWLNYLLVNGPDDYFGGYSWYDFAGEAASGVARSRQLLFELLDAQPHRGFPTGQTVLFGFSQGCLMAIEVGLRYPHRLAGVIGVSGHVHDLDALVAELSPVARQQRFLITHGRYDPLIPFAPVRQQIQQLQDAGLAIEWREFAKDHTIAGEEELDLIRAFVVQSYAA